MFHFDPIFGSYLLIVAAALVLLIPLAWPPALRPLPPRRRGVLAGIRAAVILLVIIAMLRPTWVYTQTRRQPATFIALMDRSRSMQVTDAGDNRSRWKALRRTIMDALPQFRELAEDVEVKLYTFGAETVQVPWDGPNFKLPDDADGTQSDIGRSLSEVVRREAGKRLMGVLLLSDGAPRVWSPTIELRDAAQELARRGDPLYTIAFGLPQEKSEVKDVAVENLSDHFTAFVKNELEIRAQLRVQGFVNKKIPIELVVENKTGETEVLGPSLLQATQDGQRLDIKLQYVPRSEGQYKLTVRAAEQPGELVTKNNQLSAYLDVLEGGLRVAYLHGETPFEPKFLRHAINDSPDMQLVSRYVSHGFRDKWPLKLGKFFGDEDEDYDVYILHSVHATALGEKNLSLLVSRVEAGKGLMMVGGVYSFGPGRYQKTGLANVLPVVMNRFAQQDFDAAVSGDQHWTQRHMVPTSTQNDFITRLADGEENGIVWSQLPPLDFVNRFQRPKDRATVLVESPDKKPLLVAGTYNLGRVLAFAGDSTWRWCMHGRQAEHKRFWRQVVLWLARRDQQENGKVWIRMPQHRFQPGARIEFTAGATSPQGDPVEEASMSVHLVLPDGQRQSVRLSPREKGYIGSFKAADRAGEFAIEMTATHPVHRLEPASERFEVFDHDLELYDPSANPSLMASLSKLTHESGGYSLAAEELPALLEKLQRRLVELQVEIQTRRQIADGVWDAWSFFLIVVTSLGCEWYLRKKWGLV